MGENLIPEIAKLLGVKIGEEFKIKVNDEREKNYEKFTYMFTESQGLVDPNENYCPTKISNIVLIMLLRGEYHVVKLPWKPQKGEMFYTYNECWNVDDYRWSGFPCDYASFKSGMVFRTEAEAIKARPRIYKEMTGKDWSE